MHSHTIKEREGEETGKQTHNIHSGPLCELPH